MIELLVGLVIVAAFIFVMAFCAARWMTDSRVEAMDEYLTRFIDWAQRVGRKEGK